MHHLPTVTYCHYLAHVWQRWNPIAITVCLLSFIVSSLSSLFFSLFLSLYFFAGISSSETAFFSYPVTSPNNQRVYFYIGCSLLSFCALLSPSHYSLTGSRWLSHLEPTSDGDFSLLKGRQVLAQRGSLGVSVYWKCVCMKYAL